MNNVIFTTAKVSNSDFYEEQTLLTNYFYCLYFIYLKVLKRKIKWIQNQLYSSCDLQTSAGFVI